MVAAGDNLMGTFDTPDLIRVEQLPLGQTDALGVRGGCVFSVAGRKLVTGCGVAAEFVGHLPQRFRVIALQVRPDLTVALDRVGDIVAVLFFQLVKALHKQGISHPTASRHGQFVCHVADGSKVAILVKDEVDTAFQTPAAPVCRLCQKLILLRHNERSNGIKGGFLVGQDYKQRLLFTAHICKGKIAGMGDSVDGLRGEQPQGGQGRGVEAASGTGRRHIGNGQKRPCRVGRREFLDILQQRHLISDGTAHFRNEPIHIGHVLKFRSFLVVAYHAKNGSRYDGTFTVRPNLFALRLTNQIVRQVPGQHFCTVGVSLTDGVNDGLEQIVAHTLFGVLEVQHQNLITQLFQEISGVVEQFGFGVGAEDGFSGESQKTDTFQNQTS